MDDADHSQRDALAEMDEILALAAGARRAAAGLTIADSATHCAGCGEPIPPGRREAVPGVRRCIECARSAESGRPALTARAGVHPRPSE